MRLHRLCNVTSFNNGASFNNLSLNKGIGSGLRSGFYNRWISELWSFMIFCEWIYNIRHIFFTTYSNTNDN